MVVPLTLSNRGMTYQTSRHLAGRHSAFSCPPVFSKDEIYDQNRLHSIATGMGPLRSSNGSLPAAHGGNHTRFVFWKLPFSVRMGSWRLMRTAEARGLPIVGYSDHSLGFRSRRLRRLQPRAGLPGFVRVLEVICLNGFECGVRPSRPGPPSLIVSCHLNSHPAGYGKFHPSSPKPPLARRLGSLPQPRREKRVRKRPFFIKNSSRTGTAAVASGRLGRSPPGSVWRYFAATRPPA